MSWTFRTPPNIRYSCSDGAFSKTHCSEDNTQKALPHKVKTQYLHLRWHAGTFFCLGKFQKWWADNQSSSIYKGSIYYIKHMYIQPFSMELDWREIWHQMDVSTMFYNCRYCIFTLWGRAQSSDFNPIQGKITSLIICTVCHIETALMQTLFVQQSSFISVTHY